VGTSSLRRTAQLLALRPDLRIESIRGNLDTRVRKVEQGFDAVVLAAAGLRRLGWQEKIAELIEPGQMCPAVGQGALAIETRDDGGTAQQVCRTLNDEATEWAVTAERGVLAALGGGCQVPIGAHASLADGRLHLRAVVISPDGATLIRRQSSGAPGEAAAMGAELGRELLGGGARAILEAVYGH
jgi:hydroxymethylbilane synthase